MAIHDHDHHAQGKDDHHAHGHAPRQFGRAFAAATFLNIALVVAQIVYGIRASSVALVADAGHNFGDVLGLVLAWVGHSAAQRPPTARYTYGLRSASILAALLNAVLLLVATGAIAWEAIRRLAEPGEVAGLIVMTVAAIGVVVNGGSALLLMAGSKGDLNVRGAFLHLLGDAAVSVGVVAAGAGILLTGWHWLDPLASLMISAVIVWSSWGLLRGAIALSLHAVPAKIDPGEVRRYLEGLDGVSGIHDLHIWPMSTTETALTVHLEMPGGHPGDALLMQAARDLKRRFSIGHATIQVEVNDETVCSLAPDETV
ncbi:MAG TPA: cation diffusion facilitator family transporter [Xanthobacteraceae bacterium]